MREYHLHALQWVGPGPGALTLACLLRTRDFEADKDRLHPRVRSIRPQRSRTPLRVPKNSLTEAEACKIIRADGTIAWDDNGDVDDTRSGERPEIDRSALRNMLIDSVESASIMWNRKLVRVEAVADHKYDLHFTDTVEKGFGLVVGAVRL